MTTHGRTGLKSGSTIGRTRANAVAQRKAEIRQAAPITVLRLRDRLALGTVLLAVLWLGWGVVRVVEWIFRQ